MTIFLVLALPFVLGQLGQFPSSVPEPGQFHRYRAAPRGSMLAIVPVDGAEFLPLQRFDISIELHKFVGSMNATDFPDTSSIVATINGEPMETYFGKGFEKETWNFGYFADAASRDRMRKTPVGVTRLGIRSVNLSKKGEYKLEVRIGQESITTYWNVREIGPRKVKNLILFIGDGMAPTMMTAARYLAKPTRFGKFGTNTLAIDRLGSIGKILTNGIDTMMTDSANSAATYTSGHKSWVNSLNVYSDTSEDTLDDPKVETIAEYIRSYKPGMCIGIVTTAEIQDATPAAMFSHTRSRDDKKQITDQQINGFKHKNILWDPKPVQADVLLGGGGQYFCSSKAANGTISKTCTPLDGKDYYDAYRKEGYTVVTSKQELDSFLGSNPLVGIFHKNNMDAWMDRYVYPSNLQSAPNSPDGQGNPAIDQPGLESMTMKAINIMSNSPRCQNGFFMLSEGASIDKEMHAMDYDRGLAELLELDRTVKATVDWAKASKDKGETGIIVTADHAQAFDVFGSVDTKYFNQQPEDDSERVQGLTEEQKMLHVSKREAIGIYDEAGWPNLVMNSEGMPTQWDGQYRLAQGKVDKPDHYENFQFASIPDFTASPMSRVLTMKDPALSKLYGRTVASANPKNRDGLHFGQYSAVGATSTVHSLQAVDLFCGGPASFRVLCSRVIDNTELFFIMAEALGLGHVGDDNDPYIPTQGMYCSSSSDNDGYNGNGGPKSGNKLSSFNLHARPSLLFLGLILVLTF